MSLHIESTENALAELKKQRTKTLTAAISVSFLGIALMGLLLYLVHIIVAVPEDPPMVAYATQEGDNPDIDTPEVTQTTQRPSSSSTSAQVKVIAAVATADVAVVNPDIEVDVPSEELSMGIDIGDGFGTGTGDGDGGGIPGIISKRCDLNDRMKRITENGGTPQCEEAVVKSLRWLKKQQNKDGSWGGAPHNYKCAMTGMALLSYLAHCETPLSEEFGETVLKGISFLVDQGMKNPVLSLVPQRNEVSYDHAVATYALCEAYTFCKQMDIPSISNLEKVVIPTAAGPTITTRRRALIRTFPSPDGTYRPSRPPNTAASAPPKAKYARPCAKPRPIAGNAASPTASSPTCRKAGKTPQHVPPWWA